MLLSRTRLVPGLRAVRAFQTVFQPSRAFASTRGLFSDEVKAEAAVEAPVVAKPTLPQRMVNALPASFKPYAELMRIDKPIGTWLLFSPCTWSATMAAYTTGAPFTQYLYTIALFGLGSILMRQGGCIINDILDRKLDAQVERTKHRPLASGAVSLPAAWGLLGAHGVAGLGVLMALPTDCFWLGCLSLPFVCAYPLFKRFTYYPQACLSLCFTWGALMGFPAMDVWALPTMLSLHASAFAWCMIYDTIYAHQDKKFDIKAGIKSTALKWAERSKPIMNRYGAAQIGLLATAGVLQGMGPFYFAATGWAAYRLFNMIKKVDLDDPANCWKWFVENINTGHVIWVGAFCDYISRLMGLY
ncbi:4-hydroxybenzoate polyprenyltransferase, mitochondrial [Trichomonascus vanleenenianus]|uniref:4-hydroxybenzoate octaprenyltransferase n=1 Tax=Trichomonascus vanleenenianus TaxID=2268995 RepID=UPI003ECB4E1C